MIFSHLLNKKPATGGWTAYFDNTKWAIIDEGAWNVGGWWDSELKFSLEQISLEPIGLWYIDYRPTKMRVTFTGMTPTSTRFFALEDTNFDSIYSLNTPAPPGYTSLTEVELTWHGENIKQFEIKAFDTSGAWKLTNIEFFI